MSIEDEVELLLAQRNVVITNWEAYNQAFAAKLAEIDGELKARGAAVPPPPGGEPTLQDKMLAIIARDGHLDYFQITNELYGADSPGNRNKAQRLVSTLAKKKLIQLVSTLHYRVRDPNEPDEDPEPEG